MRMNNRMNNHNEKTVRGEKDDAQLTDLGLTDEELDNIKGGRTGSEGGGGGRTGGDWIINHNETTVSDKEGEARLADLAVAREQAEEVSGGRLRGYGNDVLIGGAGNDFVR